MALAAGGAVSCVMCRVSSKAEVRGWKLGVGKYAVVIMFLFAAGLMARGLLHSYSRGAWLATFCGIAYLLWQCVNRESILFRSSRGNEAPFVDPSTLDPQHSTATLNWFHRNVLSLAAIVFCVGILLFWHFRQTEWHPARRAFSAVNTVDFSWRNRLPAWEGALQITVEHPWFGTDWNQPMPLYEHYYLSPKLTESAAIAMNDYLMLGAILGIPALFCFGMYLWLSLMRNVECGVRNGNQKPEAGIQESALPPSILHPPFSILLAATCRAGAIVLLVGFWFDGGLFKLATASTFWILLELGTVQLLSADGQNQPGRVE